MTANRVELIKNVEAAIVKLRPFLEADGGDMELVDITEENVVRVRLMGACKTCSMSIMTMKAGLEESIKKIAPEITRVEAINEEIAEVNQ
ncbi:NifU family protein [Flavobacteriales bacterium]|jgi:Fe-S cluster biogenesis protein NfuA|nr:NifU family protein [Flavobacteriales bacterium]